MMPKISVILPVFNSEDFIYATLQSILEQTFSDFEVIVIDDASTDTTPNILKRFKDPRIRIITNTRNCGVPVNRNKGLMLAQGEYIANMDADDIAHRRRFERQLEYLNNHPQVDICGTCVQIFGSESKIILTAEEDEDIVAGLLFLNVIFNPSVLFRKDKLERLGIRYDEEFVLLEDYKLWRDVAGKLKFANVPEVLLKYRIHDTNVSVFRIENRNKLNYFHHKIYESFLDVLKISYNEEDLIRHRKLGLNQVKNLSIAELNKYLDWFMTIIKANNRESYFSRKALNKIIINYIISFLKNNTFSAASMYLVLKGMSKMFSVLDIIEFVRYKKSFKKTLYSLREF